MIKFSRSALDETDDEEYSDSEDKEDPSVPSTSTHVRSKKSGSVSARKDVSVVKENKSGGVPPQPSSMFDELIDGRNGFTMDPKAYQLTGELPRLDVPMNFRNFHAKQDARIGDHEEVIIEHVDDYEPVRLEERVEENINQLADAMIGMMDEPQQVKKRENGHFFG